MFFFFFCQYTDRFSGGQDFSASLYSQQGAPHTFSYSYEFLRICTIQEKNKLMLLMMNDDNNCVKA